MARYIRPFKYTDASCRIIRKSDLQHKLTINTQGFLVHVFVSLALVANQSGRVRFTLDAVREVGEVLIHNLHTCRYSYVNQFNTHTKEMLHARHYYLPTSRVPASRENYY